MDGQEIVSTFWQDTFGTSKKSILILESILSAYSSKSRFYHNLSHLAYGISQYKDACKIISTEEKKSLALAWIYHDLIYDTKVADLENVRSSAEFAVLVSQELGFSSKDARLVGKAVLATAHRQIPEKSIEKVIADMDLSIFGADARTYSAYERNIRNEYSWVPFNEFKQKRIEVLEGFQKRKNIFWTSQFEERLGLIARVNLEWSTSMLSQGWDYNRHARA